MVTAIQFAVRNDAGGRQLGNVAGDAQGNFIQVGVGDSISLNVSPSSVVAFEQQGRDLVITLADGRMIVLAGYYDPAGGASHLYLSADGEITEVILTGDGTGVMTASYGPAQPMEKWSPLDDLRFLESDVIASADPVTDEPAGMGLFAPALMGLGGAGAAGLGLLGIGLVGGGGGNSGGGGDTTPGGGDTTPGGGDTTPGGGDTTPGGGDTTPGGGDTTPGGGDTTPGGGDPRAVPTVNDPNRVETLTTNTPTPTIRITGTGEPGDQVVVTVGNKTETTVITVDGTWGVIFDRAELPADGNYSSQVKVTEPGGVVHTLDGPDYIIDMTPPAVEVTEGTESAGDLENLADYADGITIAGEGEVGATIAIALQGITRSTTVNAAGEWSFTFTQAEIAGGERTVDVRITATDPLGNVTVLNDRLVIDTVPHPVAIDAVTTNNEVQQSEYNAGFTMTGTTAANTTLTLVVEGGGRSVTRTVTSNAEGVWSQAFPEGTIAAGTYQATATLSTVDAAGNPSSTTRTFNVDTEVAVAFDALPIAGDNVVNATEAAAGVTMTGTSAPGSVVSVQWGATTLPADANAATGNWTVTFPRTAITAGTYPTTAIVSAQDAAGNTSTDRRDIRVDTQVSVAIDDTQDVGTTVSGSERGAGFTLTGTGEANADIVVTFQSPTGSVTRSLKVGSDGTWAVNYAANEIAGGTYTAEVRVDVVDAAGNRSSDTQTIAVDTETRVDIGAIRNANPANMDDNTITGAERASGITLTGTAEANAVLTVTFNGTDYANVRANAAGEWSVAVATGGIPQGTTTAIVGVTARDVHGNVATDTHTVNIDTEVVPLTVTTRSSGSDNVLNNAEAGNGLTITGTVEAGATSVMVSFDGNAARPATIANGVWSVTIPSGEIPPGTTTANLSVTATDRFGNTGVHSEVVTIDREVKPLDFSQAVLSTDGYVNLTEAAANLVVTGIAEPFSTVAVQIKVGTAMIGTPITVTTGASGDWSATFAGNNMPRGELAAQVVVRATDLAQNVAEVTRNIIIDTVAPGAPDVVKFERISGGLTGIVTEAASETYEFTRIDANGTASEISAVRFANPATQDDNIYFGTGFGQTFRSTPVPDGSYLVIDSTDLAGNQSSTLLIVNNSNAPDIDLSRPGLSGFDFSTIDLSFAPDADLTITEADILNLTGADKTLIVKVDTDVSGATNDTVTLVGGVRTGRTAEIDGETYNIYTVGPSGATVMLDDDIQPL